jgi:glycosyltransferase involved in cell wall biosynthesis
MESCLSRVEEARPLVSVVIPVYNRAHLLGRAIRSVLAQTFVDLELLVVDDGSSDGIADVVGSFGDPRLRLVRLPRRGGVARARNVGMGQARGDLGAFLDSDDEWLPSKLEQQIARLRQHSAGHTVVSCQFVRYNDLTRRLTAPVSAFSRGDSFDQIVRGRAPIPSCLVVPRAALEAVGGLDEGLPTFADYELLLRLADASILFVEVDEVLVIKHEHGTRQISGDPDTMLCAFLILEQKWGARIRERAGRVAYRRWRAGLLTSIQYVRVRQAVARGDRPAAWRHWARMCRHLPWSGRYALYGLGLATLGLNAYDALARVKDAAARALRPR